MLLSDIVTLSNEQMAAILSIVGILISTVISLILYLLTGRKGRKERLTSKFNATYKTSFSIKDAIENLFFLQINNNKFYFELDYILNNRDIQDIVLDYITELENYFSIVLGKFRLDNSFKKLSSFALYSRWCSFYGFIIKMRNKSQNKKMFSNYMRVIDKMESMDKIKSRITVPKNLYYVGIRGSDCILPQYKQSRIKHHSDNLFKGSIDMFPGTKAQFPIRPNQNINGKVFLPYVANEINQILNHSNAPKFMFYNPSMAYKLSAEIRKHAICLNDNVLLNMINDKIICRSWLMNNGIDIISFKTMLGKEIRNLNYDNLGNSCKLVIQSNYGGGGIGTYLFDKDNFDAKKNILQDLGQYLVSPYIENSISVNTHIVISEKQTILTPGSIQIIEVIDDQLCYRGADYIAFKQLDKSSQNKVRDTSIKIANLLHLKGYRGVAGIDFILTQNGELYCSEINPRFQASTVLLDLYLAKNVNNGLASSVAELNIQAFNNAIKSDLCFDDDIGCSCYYYYEDDKPIEYFWEKARVFSVNNVRIDTDGFNTDTKTDRNSYLFRAVFNHQICSISPDNTLWINDNILVANKPAKLLNLKVALLNQGVRMENIQGEIKKGVYESVDITLKCSLNQNQPVDINCATGINLSHYSPFVLDGKNNTLKYYNESIGEFTIEKNLPDMLDRKILYKSTDRIRIKMISGCEYKNIGKGCEFCNVPYSEKTFTLDEIKQALQKLKYSSIEFKHILIGGGTCLNPDIWAKIIDLTLWLKSNEYFKSKPISLMSVLPPLGKDKEDILDRLKRAGIEEVAFNLEVCDEQLAKKLMPGKYKDKETFYNVMEQAIKIFGVNSVRSALVVGIDKEKDLINEVCNMASMGIMPCLSALRALPGANAHYKIHPSNEYLIDIYLKCKTALNKSDYSVKQMGPPCIRCRNNMLIE